MFYVLSSTTLKAQTVPSVDEVFQFFNNKNLLITSREGEVLYGTYYFLEIHFCPSGQYGLYGRSVKQTVLGNEQRSNWQEFGNWKIIRQNGLVGIRYISNQGGQSFYPIYRQNNGALSAGEGVSVVNQGSAICN